MTRSPGFAPPRRFAAVLLALSAACSHAPPRTAPAPRPEPSAAEQIGDAPEIEKERPTAVSASILGTATYDLPVVANLWVESELGFLVNQRHDVVGRWLERADYYDEWVQGVFSGYGLPRDLHHLAMVESGYLPTARSRAGAVGMWQFMSGTGRGMGLRIDELVDERMDPVRSTHAAARHLKELHGTFGGDWALAAAAYNAGSGRIGRGLGRFGVRNFWDLASVGDLAEETKHYVPRLYAVTIIGRDRARFGYPAPRGLVRRFAYDSVQVDIPTPLAELARIGSLSLDELRALNPHLLQGIAPARYWVWTPDGSGTATQVAFQNSAFRRDGGYSPYTVRRGDDLDRLAELSGVPAERIRELNPSLPDSASLRAGQRLSLPAAAARALSARPVERTASRDSEDRDGEPAATRRRGSSASSARDEGSSSSSSRRSSERTASRDTRAKGSERAESSTARRSTTASRASEDEGERTSRSDSASSRSRAGSSERVADAGLSPARRPASESRSGSSSSRSSSASASEGGKSSSSSAREHTVAGGETLWSIARQYDLSVVAVQEANGLEGSTLQPGQKLRIPRAASGSSSPSSSSSGAPAARTASREDSGRTSQGASRSSGSGATSRASGTGRAAASRTAARSDNAAARFAEHVVKAGETLWSIARRYSSSVDAIRGANDLGEQQAIQPGQTLKIPVSAR